MTREETKKIIMVISAAYPNYHPDNLSFTVDLWASLMKEYTYEMVSAALNSYLTSNSSGFAPSPGQIIENLHMITCQQELTEMEAWTLVRKAVRNGYYGAEKEFDKLPSIVQKAVGSPSQLRAWSQTEVEHLEDVIQSNFLRTYRVELEREKQISKMPSYVQKLISNVNEGRICLPRPAMEESVQIEMKHTGVEMPESAIKRMKELLGDNS